MATSLHLTDMIKRSDFIAFVEIQRVHKRKNLVIARVIERFKGEDSVNVELGVPTLWAIPQDGWFRPKELCVVLAGDCPAFAYAEPNELITHGLLGRMPIRTINGKEVIGVFSDEPRYFDPVPSFATTYSGEYVEFYWAEWKAVREQLLLPIRQ